MTEREKSPIVAMRIWQPFYFAIYYESNKHFNYTDPTLSRNLLVHFYFVIRDFPAQLKGKGRQAGEGRKKGCRRFAVLLLHGVPFHYHAL